MYNKRVRGVKPQSINHGLNSLTKDAELRVRKYANISRLFRVIATAGGAQQFSICEIYVKSKKLQIAFHVFSSTGMWQLTIIGKTPFRRCLYESGFHKNSFLKQSHRHKTFLNRSFSALILTAIYLEFA